MTLPLSYIRIALLWIFNSSRNETAQQAKLIWVGPRRRLRHDHSLEHVNVMTGLGQVIHSRRTVRHDPAHVHVHLTKHHGRFFFELRQQFRVHATPNASSNIVLRRNNADLTGLEPASPNLTGWCSAN